MNKKTPEKMKNIPEKIFLQLGEDIEGVKDFKEFHSEAISWCADKIYDTDIEYVINNESLIEEMREALQCAKDYMKITITQDMTCDDESHHYLRNNIYYQKISTVLQKIKSKS